MLSARKHKIGRARAKYVIEHPYIVIAQRPPVDSPVQDPRLIFLGDDHTDRALEVVAIETKTGLLVIHAMDLRTKWRAEYERGKNA